MDDDLDSLLAGGPAAPAATAAAPPTAAAPAAAPVAAQPMEDEEEDEDDDDDDDDGIALVLDAPTNAPRAGGAFGTPITIKTQRYSKWGTPGQTPAGAPAAGTPATAAAPVVVTSVQYPPVIAPSSVTTGGASAAAAAPTAARPFRLPLPNDNIFDAGQSLDSRIERPWTLPGADLSDWFNYGFDEETWKLYCQKQIQQRINAKMKGKLTVFDGDEPLPMMRQSRAPHTGGPPQRPPAPHMPMMQQQRPPMPMPYAAPGVYPPQMQQRPIAAYNDDDASVPLGGGHARTYMPPTQHQGGAPMTKRET